MLKFYELFFWLFLINNTYATAVCNQKIKVSATPLLIANHSQAQVYYIKNLTKQTLALDKIASKKSMQAGWRSMLDAKRWSALVVANLPFRLACFNQLNQQITCAKAIKICRAAIDYAADSNYWVVENASYEAMVTKTQERAKLKS